MQQSSLHPEKPFLIAFWLALVAGCGVVIWWWWGSASDALAALQVLLAFGAAIAATGALWATWPQYRAFSALPDIDLYMQWAETVHQKPQRAPKHVIFSGDSFIVRAVIHSKGSGTLRNGLLNIIVPTTCTLRVLDEGKTHYVSPMIDDNAVISEDGKTPIDVRFSCARDDFFPGAHVFHVEVLPLPNAQGPFPVVLDLSGDTIQSMSTRHVFARALAAKPHHDAKRHAPAHEGHHN